MFWTWGIVACLPEGYFKGELLPSVLSHSLQAGKIPRYPKSYLCAAYHMCFHHVPSEQVYSVVHLVSFKVK